MTFTEFKEQVEGKILAVDKLYNLHRKYILDISSKVEFLGMEKGNIAKYEFYNLDKDNKVLVRVKA